MATDTTTDTTGKDTGPNERNISKIPDILPRERVFPIQIGGELFMLSGASISSDAPSYFSQYFRCQIATAQENGTEISTAIRTLYIDRDPVTFRDIALHLQGYHIQPRDGTHFVRLFADAQFYSLPRLMSQLYQESIFISIGHREFQIPRDVLTDPGNSPNYFSLGFGILFSSPHEVFPGLEREGLIRPPSILPPSVPNRSADTFADLLHLLQGYPVDIRNETHREELLRDARYFHFKGLEQRLIPHSRSFNSTRQRSEITLRLENVQKSGVSVVHDDDDDGDGGDASGGSTENAHTPGWVNYARPYVDDKPAELVLEVGDEATRIHFTSDGPRAEFFGDTRARVAKLLEVIATKLSLPPTMQPLGLLMASGGAGGQAPSPGNTSLSEDLVRVSLNDDETAIMLDGKTHNSYLHNDAAGSVDGSQPRKRKRADDGAVVEKMPSWTVKTGQWRLRLQTSTGAKSPLECVFVGVQLDAVTSELGRNMTRGFLRA